MKYKIIVDKQSSKNPSNEKKEYVVDIEELRVKGDIYDSLIITNEEDYVIRRLSLSKYHVLSVLDEPIKEKLPDLNIELFEGDNYIYLMDMEGNKFYAEYIVKNDFTDIYCTKNEMNSAINQSAQKIELSVNQKLTGYATTNEMNSKIEMKADSIISQVNNTLKNYDTSKEVSSKIEQKADSITSSVSKTYTTKQELNTAKSEIKQTTDSITSTVSKKVGNDEIISRINQSAESIIIDADRIDISGKKVKFKTNISSSYKYSNEDLTNIRKYITGEISLTSTQQELYDINKDGKVSPSDYVLLKQKLGSSGGTVVIEGTLQIDPDSASRTLILRDSSGNIMTSIGLLGMQTQSFYSQYISSDTGTITDLTIEGTFTNNSDKRLKKNIKKLTDDYMNLLNYINPVSFEYIKDPKGNTHIGFLAQEVEKAFKDNNIKASPIYIDDYGIYSIEYMQFLGILWKIVQKQQKTIECLEKRIETLEKEAKND